MFVLSMKKILFAFAIILLLLLVVGGFYLFPRLPVINGFAAKKTCSCTFIADRSLASIQESDLQIFPVNYTTNRIDKEEKTVKTSLFGIGERTAVYRNGLGCTLLPAGMDKMEKQSLSRPSAKNRKDDLFPGQMIGTKNPAIISAFDKDEERIKNTRAVVVVRNDSLIAEHYADGFDTETPILGWSMTKSITNALIGILVKEEVLNVNQNNLFTKWSADERKNITLANLLNMGSGLDFGEIYSEVSDATTMLYNSEDMGHYALDQPLIHEPGTHWAYSSGTSNILSKIVKREFQNDIQYFQFPYTELFYKLGMFTAELETDPSGLFVGSSYCYATPRDWAKFGMLYLKDGNWFGEQIFKSDWVDYSVANFEPSDGEYGAQIWLNHGGKLPDISRDVYWFSGFQGQRVFVIPSKNMVVVRMGLSSDGSFDFNTFLKKILDEF